MKYRSRNLRRGSRKDASGNGKSASSFVEATATISLSREASAMPAIRIRVVASVRLFREGLAQILDRRERLTIVGMARDSMEALGGIWEAGVLPGSLPNGQRDRLSKFRRLEGGQPARSPTRCRVGKASTYVGLVYCLCSPNEIAHIPKE